MSLLEKFRGNPHKNTPEQSPLYAEPIPPVEGEEKEKLERIAEELLAKDLSEAVYNDYVDTMIKILGTGEYAEYGTASSNPVIVKDTEEHRTIVFGRDKKNRRSIVTSSGRKDGYGKNFGVGAEKLSLSDFANEASEDMDYFGVLTTYFEAPKRNFMIPKFPSFIAQKEIELRPEYQQADALNLGEVKSFLDYSHEIYKTHHLEGGSQNLTTE